MRAAMKGVTEPAASTIVIKVTPLPVLLPTAPVYVVGIIAGARTWWSEADLGGAVVIVLMLILLVMRVVVFLLALRGERRIILDDVGVTWTSTGQVLGWTEIGLVRPCRMGASAFGLGPRRGIAVSTLAQVAYGKRATSRPMSQVIDLRWTGLPTRTLLDWVDARHPALVRR